MQKDLIKKALRKCIVPKNLYSELCKVNKQKLIGQKGYGIIPPFIGYKQQQGNGIGNIIGGLFLTVVPFIKPMIKSAAKNVGKEFLRGVWKLHPMLCKEVILKKQ